LKTHLEPIRVLVVEDEPTIARVCIRTLTAQGYQVEVAEDGRKAERTFGVKEFDLYILDIRTPEINGMELYQEMRKNYPSLTGRVLFTSGDTLSVGIREFLEDNGRPYLAKPFTPSELRSLVGQCFGQPELVVSV
jgi:DNA-binding response OmpR family regulator